jgi:Holliday junction resolvasome RuvABC ATP-dependent DNA helicase subunit
LGRLELGINRALVSRLGFSLQLGPWPIEILKQYVHQRLLEVGIHVSPLEAAAEELLVKSAQGSPRVANHLLQRALEQAAMAQRRQVTALDVQKALDQLPWLSRLAPAGS